MSGEDGVGRSKRVFTPFVIAMIFTSFVMGTAEFIIIGTSDVLAAAMDVPLAQIGLLVSVFAIAYILATPLVTITTTRFERFRLMLGLTAVFCLSLLLPLVWSNYPALVISRVLTAATAGPILSMGMALTMEQADPEVCGQAVAWVFAGFSIATIVSLPLGVWLGQHVGWRAIFLVSIILGLVVMLLLTLFMKKGTYAQPRVKGDVGGTIKDPRILLGVLMMVCSVTGLYVLYTYITPYMQDIVGFTADEVGLMLIGFGVASVAGSIASGIVASKWGMKVFPFVFAVQALLLMLMPGAVAFKAVFLVLLFLLGFSIPLINSTNQLHFVQVAAQEHPSMIGFVSSLNPISFNIGTALGAAVGSAAVAAAGGLMANLPYFGVVFSLLAVLCVVALRRLERDPAKRTQIS